MSAPAITLLILNPNSSPSITSSLASTLVAPQGVTLRFLSGPAGEAPEAIVDTETSCRSAVACARMLREESKEVVDECDGVLVCCFSDHPLVPLLQEALPGKPILGMFDASLALSLLLGPAFAILTTGQGMVPGIDAGVVRVLGGNSARFKGTFASNLGVLELHDGEKAHVERVMKATAARCCAAGAEVVVLGCAGMAGMEELVKKGYREAGARRECKVVDGVKAGVELLAGMCRIAC